MSRADTIFALSSGKLPSGIAVFRLSGANSRFVLETICGSVPSPRLMRPVTMKDASGGIIDRGLCVYFPGPASFTGEDSGEIHFHGSVAVAKKLADTLSAMVDVRPAEAGEFTRRAFLNGKIDLAEAEGLSDLISAETDAQRRLALLQSEGKLSAVYADWRERLVQSRAMVEAAIDFSEEDEVQAEALKAVLPEIELLREEIGNWIERSGRAEIIRNGFNVVIIGAPNSGKSSLLNVLAGREVAIVTDEPGTTRDLIDVRLELDGNLVIVTDTAGIRAAAGKVENIGIGKAINKALEADLAIVLEDASSAEKKDIDIAVARKLIVGNKSDQGVVDPARYDLIISAKSGSGIDPLIATLSSLAASPTYGVELLTVQQRQKDLLFECLVSLDRCIVDHKDKDIEMIAEHLRVASACLGRLTGAVDVEELLGVIFSRFCIGK